MQRPSESGNWNLDVVQTLVRAVLKIGGGYLLAQGLADESTLEAVSAGAVALVAIIRGVRHRTTGRGSTTLGSLGPASFLFCSSHWWCADALRSPRRRSAMRWLLWTRRALKRHFKMPEQNTFEAAQQN